LAIAVVLAACFPSADTEPPLPPPPVADYAIATYEAEEPLAIKTWTREEVEAEAFRVATEHELDAELFVAVVKCESSFVKDAVGDGGHSIGVVQIHEPSHPQISREQAENPEFALTWMAEQWSAGRAGMWSCLRIVQ